MAKLDEIEGYLKSQNVNYKLINLPAVAISVADVVRLSGGQVREEEIIKTLIVKTKTGQFLGCVLRGKDRLKGEVMERLASREEVLQIAGVDFGAVCPILLEIPIVIDQKIARLKRVNMGSGDHLRGLEMDFADLLGVLSNYTVKEIAQ